jgi:hypothetical protein
MHVLKVAFLLFLTLAAMRALSWACLFVFGWLLKRQPVQVRLAANVLALSGFAGLLHLDSLPGEFLDLRALAFGVVIYAVYFAIDIKWIPRFLSVESIAARVRAEP